MPKVGKWLWSNRRGLRLVPRSRVAADRRARMSSARRIQPYASAISATARGDGAGGRSRGAMRPLRLDRGRDEDPGQ
jgi:hypothetical protein